MHTPAYRAFLVQLITARERTGLTQVQVAKRLGWPQSRISRMETGERRVDVVELQCFATLYRRPLSWFVRAHTSYLTR
ncbi:MAG: helix-turn-helix transcriptional regulator [Gemmatimonadales bacterium]|nr:helix-turn-helix transcriptional regulator [Gemmatimonadales bacterium]